MSDPARTVHRKRARAFLKHVAGLVDPSEDDGFQVVPVVHLVESAREFLPALGTLATIPLVLPKPRSIDPSVAAWVHENYATAPIGRDGAAGTTAVADAVAAAVNHTRPVVLMDIGGYFAMATTKIADRLGTSFRGIVEGTENGVQKYEEADLRCPVYTVARSPLKYPENHLVGAGVVFSVEAILRSRGEVLQGHRTAVIGYGRIGRGVAHALRGRFVDVIVTDTNPVALAEAAAHGFGVARTIREVLQVADLVISATGKKALTLDDLRFIRPEAYLASVTSADDELNIEGIDSRFTSREEGPHVTRYRTDQGSFYLIAGGNAVNFVHGAALGPAIQLVEGEKLACLAAVIRHDSSRGDGLFDLDEETRQLVASTWLQHYVRP
ncbi:MAG: adenosylhomocysteinase [Gemmatimonadaceae bacterium]|nr:adenosylhomocysteinase [Gemmatimonadaceae bacterium]